MRRRRPGDDLRVERRRGGHGLRQIRAGHPGRRTDPFDERHRVEILGRDRRTHRAPVPDPKGQPARVDPLDPGDRGVLQRVGQRTAGAPGARAAGDLTRDEPGHLDAPALRVVGVHAVVPLVRGRHGDDLPRVGRVRQDLLISRHARVEDGLAERLAGCSEPRPSEHRAVLQREQRGAAAGRHLVGFPSATTSAPR